MIIKCKDYHLFLTSFGTEENFINFSSLETEACELSQEQLTVFEALYGDVLEYQVLYKEVCVA